MELAGIVEGRFTATKAVSATLVSPAWRLASKVWVPVGAGLTDTVVDAVEVSWVGSPAYMAVSAKLTPVGLVMLVEVNTTWQLAEPAEPPPNEHVVGLNVAVLPGELGAAVQLTDPLGVTIVPKLVSVTVTWQLARAPTISAAGWPW